MEHMDILNDLNSIFGEILKRDNIILQRDFSAKDVDGWDSLTNMILISKIEEKYDVRFNFREIIKMNNVGDLCDQIASKLENR